MTDREIMQQALEALEEINKLSIGENAICLPAEIDGAMDALRSRLAQPEQEPVAWMVLGDGKYGEYTPGMHFDTVGHKEYWERRGYELQPLYTAPPQRKKLPPQTPCLLTQAENKMFRFGWLECEAAHGIKGEA